MASVNWHKCNGSRSTKSIIRHCVTDTRLKQNHSNTDIDKSLTEQNWSLYGLNYADLCAKYDARINDLDSTTNDNKRKDRVTCFSLYTSCPRDLPEDKADEWFAKTIEIIKSKYGEKNIIDAVVHKDEVHEYIDPKTKEKCISRSHVHVFVVPEKNGKLIAKEFSSRSNMKSLNKAIHEMTERDYGVKYMTGEQARHKSVEVLKNESKIAELDISIEAKKMEAERIIDDADQEAGQIIAGAQRDAGTIRETARAEAIEEIKTDPDIQDRIVERAAEIEYKDKRSRIDYYIKILTAFKDNILDRCAELIRESGLGRLYRTRESCVGEVIKLDLNGDTYKQGEDKKLEKEIQSLYKGYRLIEEQYREQTKGMDR